jgi:hypothetical protein
LLRFRRKNHLLSDTLLSWLLLDMTSSYLLLLLLILLLERMLRLMLLAMLLLLTMLLMHRMLEGLYVLRRQGGRSAGLLRYRGRSRRRLHWSGIGPRLLLL